MPLTCTICRHEKRNEIDEALLNGEPLRNIAKQNGTSVTALYRHKKAHITATLTSAKQATEELSAEPLFERLRAINRETAAILAEARASNSPGLALQAIARLEKQVELEARLLSELSNSVQQPHQLFAKLVLVRAGSDD
jgi:hypothetical protein